MKTQRIYIENLESVNCDLRNLRDVINNLHEQCKTNELQFGEDSEITVSARERYYHFTQALDCIFGTLCGCDENGIYFSVLDRED